MPLLLTVYLVIAGVWLVIGVAVTLCMVADYKRSGSKSDAKWLFWSTVTTASAPVWPLTVVAVVLWCVWLIVKGCWNSTGIVRKAAQHAYGDKLPL